MRNLLFRFLFGSDAMAVNMLKLLNLRKAAAKRSLENLKIKLRIAKEEERLNTGKQVMGSIRSDYADTKNQLERAYNWGFEEE